VDALSNFLPAAFRIRLHGKNLKSFTFVIFRQRILIIDMNLAQFNGYAAAIRTSDEGNVPEKS
jgi:hypothetical protein